MVGGSLRYIGWERNGRLRSLGDRLPMWWVMATIVPHSQPMLSYRHSPHCRVHSVAPAAGARCAFGSLLFFCWAGLLPVVAEVAAEGFVVEDDFALEVGVVVVLDALDGGACSGGQLLNHAAEGVVLILNH